MYGKRSIFFPPLTTLLTATIFSLLNCVEGVESAVDLSQFHNEMSKGTLKRWE